MKKKTKAKGKKSCEFRFCLLNWRLIKGSGVIPRKLLKTEVWFHRRDVEIIHLCTVKLWESASLSSRWAAPELAWRNHWSVKAKQAGGYRKLRDKMSTVTDFKSFEQDIGESFVKVVMNIFKK